MEGSRLFKLSLEGYIDCEKLKLLAMWPTANGLANSELFLLQSTINCRYLHVLALSSVYFVTDVLSNNRQDHAIF